jgi:hypothetical protein
MLSHRLQLCLPSHSTPSTFTSNIKIYHLQNRDQHYVPHDERCTRSRRRSRGYESEITPTTKPCKLLSIVYICSSLVDHAFPKPTQALPTIDRPKHMESVPMCNSLRSLGLPPRRSRVFCRRPVPSSYPTMAITDTAPDYAKVDVLGSRYPSSASKPQLSTPLRFPPL